MKYKICKLLWQALYMVCCQGVSNTGLSVYVITLLTLVFSSRAQVLSTIEMRLKLYRRFLGAKAPLGIASVRKEGSK